VFVGLPGDVATAASGQEESEATHGTGPIQRPEMAAHVVSRTYPSTHSVLLPQLTTQRSIGGCYLHHLGAAEVSE